MKVTILILIDGFLQFNSTIKAVKSSSHNPYFNRWFSAIQQTAQKKTEKKQSQSLF